MVYERPAVAAWYDTTRTCPRCRSRLVTDGRILWCSFQGGFVLHTNEKTPRCEFGRDSEVRVEDVPQVPR